MLFSANALSLKQADPVQVDIPDALVSVPALDHEDADHEVTVIDSSSSNDH